MMLQEIDGGKTGAEPRRTFIEVTEVWVPDQEGERLTLAEGIYGSLHSFATASAEESFVKGEGLPGKAWAEARPVILKGFRGSYFKRTEAAEAVGLTTAVAIPVFAGERLKAVLVFLCADDEQRTGAIEVWRAGEGPAAVLHLDDGYFGAAKHFAWVSQHTQFPRGQGLPGGVWAAGAPMLLRDLGGAYRFIRSESAGQAGLTTGLGLPIPVPGEEVYVLTLLSARGTPIARRFELWEARHGRAGKPSDVVLIDGLCEREGALWGTPRSIGAWQGQIGRVVATGVPVAAAGGKAPGLPADYQAVVALPIHRGHELAHVAAWYF